MIHKALSGQMVASHETVVKIAIHCRSLVKICDVRESRSQAMVPMESSILLYTLLC